MYREQKPQVGPENRAAPLEGKPVNNNVKQYVKTFRKINSPSDCLKYSIEFIEDWNASLPRKVAYPYCPEYLVQPPSREYITKFLQEKQADLVSLASKYRVVQPYHKRYNYDNEQSRLVSAEVEEGERIDFQELTEDQSYQLVVDMFFNEAITDKKWAKQKQ